jgi:hypothetical protein
VSSAVVSQLKNVAPYFTSVLLCFSGPSAGSLMPQQLSVENRVPLKALLGGVKDVALIVQAQSNRVCKFHIILLFLMLPRDHFV